MFLYVPLPAPVGKIPLIFPAPHRGEGLEVGLINVIVPVNVKP